MFECGPEAFAQARAKMTQQQQELYDEFAHDRTTKKRGKQIIELWNWLEKKRGGTTDFFGKPLFGGDRGGKQV